MDHYLEYHLVPDEALAEPALTSAFFTHLHSALVVEQRDDVGVSFQQARKDHLGVMPDSSPPILNAISPHKQLPSVMTLTL